MPHTKEPFSWVLLYERNSENENEIENGNAEEIEEEIRVNEEEKWLCSMN